MVGSPATGAPEEGFAIARLHPDGTADDSFGFGASTLAPSGRWWARAAVLPSQDTLVVGGTLSEGAPERFALARYDLGPIGEDCLPRARTCRVAAKASMVVVDSAEDRRDKLIWKWSRGASVTTTELGDPTVDAGYSWCVYDAALDLVEASTLRVPAGPAWSALGDRGFGYIDSTAASDGVQRLMVRSSDRDRAKALLKARGEGLPAIATPLPVPLTVQLVNERNGECLGVTFEAGDVSRNADGRFKARRR